MPSRALFPGVRCPRSGEKLKGCVKKELKNYPPHQKNQKITPPHPTPHPPRLPSLSTGKLPPTTHLNPTQNPCPTDTTRSSHPFAKTTPGKNYPLVSAQSIWLIGFSVKALEGPFMYRLEVIMRNLAVPRAPLRNFLARILEYTRFS